MNKFPFFTIVIIGLVACNTNNFSDEKPVAKVYDEYLYLGEIKNIVPDNSSREDSTLISENFIRQWIKKQLLISKAELNLPEEEKDVSRLVEDYRASLLIHKYQQILLKQKLDTVIKQEEIDKYYENYKSNFVLSENIVKALYIKIPIPVPNLERVRKLYKSKKRTDVEKLEDYCFQNATKFDDFDNQWIYFPNLLNKTPFKINKESVFLEKNKYFEAKDLSHHYFVEIKNYKLKNTLAPKTFVQEDIRRIILNKRKLQFIKSLEEDIYKNAQLKNKFKIY